MTNYLSGLFHGLLIAGGLFGLHLSRNPWAMFVGGASLIVVVYMVTCSIVDELLGTTPWRPGRRSIPHGR